MVTDRSWSLLDLYHHYRSGFLPLAGGMLDQPHAFSQAMIVITAEIRSD